MPVTKKAAGRNIPPAADICKRNAGCGAVKLALTSIQGYYSDKIKKRGKSHIFKTFSGVFHIHSIFYYRFTLQ